MAFDEQKADAACNFFERVLKHTADEWWGKPFLLAPWEEEALRTIFGTIDESGNRVIEMAYLEVPKKAGKTEFVAGILLYVLVTTSTPGCQAYGAAAATRQAMNVYRAACKMVEQSPVLGKRLRIMRGTNRIVKRTDPDSFYAAVAADGDFGDGVNPAFTVADEVHRWKTRKQLENWDVLSKGGITRSQTLTIGITTAGVQDESPLALKLHDKTRKIKDGIVRDGRFFGRIYAADRTDDPGAPATWLKANPSLKDNGGFLEIDKIRKEYESAVAEGDLTSFKRYFLNVWDQREDRAIDIGKWDIGHGGWKAEGLLPKPEDAKPEEVRPLPHEYVKRFFGRRAWAGVDISMTTDFTAVAFVFPRETTGEKDEYDVLPFFWLPAEKLRKLELKLSVPLSHWERDGFLEVCDGGVVDLRDIEARLKWGASMFDLQEICWDPWNSRQSSVSMIEQGYTCIEVRQGFATLNEPTKKVLELVERGGLHHGGHPILRFNAGSACLHPDRKDNVMFDKPDRAKNAARIDGMAATVNALSRAMLNASSKPNRDSIFDRGAFWA
ncbi:MAG: terminase large subunit [Terriglobales bacterium]